MRASLKPPELIFFFHIVIARRSCLTRSWFEFGASSSILDCNHETHEKSVSRFGGSQPAGPLAGQPPVTGKASVTGEAGPQALVTGKGTVTGKVPRGALR